MDDGGRREALAMALAVAAAVLASAAIVLALIQPAQAGLISTIVACLAAGYVTAPIGALVVRRRGNPVGWVLLGIGLSLSFAEATLEYGVVAATGRIDLPLWQPIVLIGFAVYTGVAGGYAVLVLLFPTGSPPSPRWRVVLWIVVTSLALTVVLQLVHTRMITSTETPAIRFPNPLAIQALDSMIAVLAPIIGVIALLALIGCLASIVVRFRRSSSDDRERIKWLAYVAVSAVLFLFFGEFGAAAAGCSNETCGNPIFNIFFAYLTMGVPVAVGFAILRRGLYDVEVVIRKTVVVALLAAFFIAVYAALVGGVGAMVHTTNSTVLSFTAAVVVALLSQPVLTRARRLADRLVYGNRATPYEVLAQFSGVMGETRSHELVLEEMARVVGEGAGAKQAEVWLRLGSSLQLAASWPSRDAALEPSIAVPAASPRLPEMPRDVAVPVMHNEELLGALSLSMPASDPATPATRMLITDLAGQAGLVLRNVQLIEELRASRRRLVTAQDEERRKLERNLHDGAQQQLIALRLRLRLAEMTIEADPATASDTLNELGDAAQAALDDLRDLARGIYPPLLAERGLKDALEGQAAKSVIAVQVVSQSSSRYPQEIEAAVYFCSLEALQNIAKYAHATSAVVRLWAEGDTLAFSIRDDGDGFDTSQLTYGTGLQGMADRLAALGGTLRVDSEAGAGTTVTGRLPISIGPDPGSAGAHDGEARPRSGATGSLRDQAQLVDQGPPRQ